MAVAVSTVAVLTVAVLDVKVLTVAVLFVVGIVCSSGFSIPCPRACPSCRCSHPSFIWDWSAPPAPVLGPQLNVAVRFTVNCCCSVRSLLFAAGYCCFGKFMLQSPQFTVAVQPILAVLWL